MLLQVWTLLILETHLNDHLFQAGVSILPSFPQLETISSLICGSSDILSGPLSETFVLKDFAS